MAEPAADCSPLDPTEVGQALEAAGWRCTPQRLAVYQVLTRALHHPSAEQVYHEVQQAIPNISLATVYKALEALVASGLAAKLAAADGSALYDARRDRHYHLRCLKTGRVEDLPTPFDPGLIDRIDPELTDQLERQGFHVTGYRLELLGYFDDPSRPQPPPAPSGPRP